MGSRKEVKSVASRSIQEMTINGKKPASDKFFYRGSSNGGVLDASVPLIQIPVLDFGLLTNTHSSPSITSQQLDNLKLALTSWGCFQVMMTSSFLDNVRNVAKPKQFFGLSMEEKQKYSREADSLEGYGNDMVLSQNETIDWTDRLYLILSQEDQKRPRFWPQNPEAFG